MKIHNTEINKFKLFLLSFDLNPQDTRKRGRFFKLLQPQLDYVDENRIELIRQYAKKDEQDNILTYVDKGQTLVVFEDRASFDREYNKMMFEEFFLEDTLEREDILLFIKNLILNPDPNRKFNGQDALEYDRWCDIVERIQYEN